MYRFEVRKGACLFYVTFYVNKSFLAKERRVPALDGAFGNCFVSRGDEAAGINI